MGDRNEPNRVGEVIFELALRYGVLIVGLGLMVTGVIIASIEPSRLQSAYENIDKGGTIAVIGAVVGAVGAGIAQ